MMEREKTTPDLLKTITEYTERPTEQSLDTLQNTNTIVKPDERAVI